MSCFCCKGVYHPSTGHMFSDAVVYCGPCIRHFIMFVKSHTKRKWSGADFYAEAATSIREGVFP